jgi:hypothetical protein
MTNRKPVEPAPGPLEDYAARFDDLFANRAQRQGFRRYLEDLLLAEERNKTLTALANTEPVVGAQRKEAQSLQWFLSESSWDPEKVSRLRIGLMLEEPATAADVSGALVIDETGDRKDGKKTAHVGHQYLGEISKIANGVVSVSSVYADERLYYPLEVEPYTPAHHFEGGKADGAFRTKPQIALELVERAVPDGDPLPGGGGRHPLRGAPRVQEGPGGQTHTLRAGRQAFLQLVPPHGGWTPDGARAGPRGRLGRGGLSGRVGCPQALLSRRARREVVGL